MKPTLQKAAPHIRRGLSSRDVMLDVLIACLPMSSGGVWKFGWRAYAAVGAVHALRF